MRGTPLPYEPAAVGWRRAGLALGVVATTLTRSVDAEPLRLRADALAESRSPTGLIVLSAQDQARPWLDADAVVWAGTRPDAAADVMVLTVRVRAPQGWGEARAGRFVIATGAIRPLQIDGVSALARAPSGTTAEAFAGAPVVPRFGEREIEIAGGGRLAQTVGAATKVGVSYVQQRGHGEIANEEIGADFASLPVPWLDVAARSAYSLQTTGFADALASAAVRSGAFRIESFATHRSASRLLPATSLFSVLGDFPSRTLGSTVRWQAAPRLDVLASAALQSVAGDLGANGWIRGLLRLDDRGDGTVGLELRRQSVATARWTGVRTVLTQPLGGGLKYSNELELVLPDAHTDGAVAWPWALVALSWRPRGAWEIAGALEASATPQHRAQTTALARVSHSWEVRP